MTKIFGHFIDDLPTSEEFLMLSFSPSSLPLQRRWRNNGLSADFVADYLTTFFVELTEGEEFSPDREAEVKGAVSYVANELLENAMKFHQDFSDLAIKFAIHLHTKKIILLSSNSVSRVALDEFEDFIINLLSHDPQDLLLMQLEKTATDDESSGLGFITMLNDYSARLGWKIDNGHNEPNVYTVTTMVQLPF